jgi:hypothetical protein
MGRKEVKNMPNLKQLIEELVDIQADPRDIRIPRDFELAKPFDQVFACTSRQRWLGIQDSNLGKQIQSLLSYR